MLAAALVAPPAAAQDSPDAEAASTVTTTLQPGWNMAAWLGEDAPVSAIFGAVPELELVSAWDAEAQIERRARPRSVLRDGLTRLTTGMGLWLRVGGGEAVEWTQEPAAGSVLLELREGRNVVGWMGRDGVPAAKALARFGDRLAAASRWDAETGGFERYRPGAPEEANTLRALRRGDVIEVELTSDARWWQSGAWRTAFEFIGGVPEERQAEIRAETAEVLAFFAERYGIVPPEFTVRVHPGLGIAANAVARLIRIGRYAVDSQLIGGTIAHEYTHVLQHYLQGLPPTEGSSSPAWLIEGQATYAGGLFFQSRGDRTGDRQRWLWWQAALDVIPPLRDLADPVPFYAEGWPAYALGALATEWLATRAEAREGSQFGGAPTAPDADGLTEHESHIRYWQAVPFAEPWRWKEAFADTFGIAVDAFYDEFEAYRAESLALIVPPHRFDDRDGPALVFLGDVPDDIRGRIEADIDRVHRFYTERFETLPAEFSIFVGTDAESVAEQYRLMRGSEPDESFCSIGGGGAVFVVAVTTCDQPLTQFERPYFSSVLERLAPWGSLPDVPEGHDPRGPEWLVLGINDYTHHAYRAATGVDTLERIRSGEIVRARRATASLPSLETNAGMGAAGYRESRSLGFLAAERLVALAGEPALFAYYGALPGTASWREAFEAAFGLTPAAFYADFEAYRTRVAPPLLLLPHLADDRAGPALAFVADVPPALRAAIEAELDRVHRFYTERFATIPAEFSIFVGTDAESVGQHLQVFAPGYEPGEGFCSIYRYEFVIVAVATCDPSTQRGRVRASLLLPRA